MSEYSYLSVLRDLIKYGDDREGRNGVTRSRFGEQVRYDLREGFPLLTTKRVFWKGVATELLWFLSGDTNAKALEDQGVNIWKEWGCPETRELGPVYGAQWVKWKTGELKRSYGEDLEFLGMKSVTINQIQNVIDSLKNDPYGRRHLVSAWNVGELDDMALPPCHFAFQFYVSSDGHLDCQLYQRSCDYFLGNPFNLASYSLLTHLMARECGYKPRYFIHTMGDVHLYENHIEAAELQLTRAPKRLPELTIHGDKGIFDITLEDLEIVGYDPHPAIKAEVSA